MGTKIKILFTVALLAAIGALGAAATNIGVPETLGVWWEEDGDFYLVFNKDGTYQDSVYGIRCPYEVHGDTLVLYDVLGRTTTAELQSNLGRHVAVHLNGQTHVLSPNRGKDQLHFPDPEPSDTAVSAYRMLNEFGSKYTLRLYDNMVFSAAFAAGTVTGFYAINSDDTLVLFTESGTDYMPSWGNGFAFGSLSNTLTYSVLQANVLEARGLLITGEVIDNDTGVTFAFKDDNTVLVDSDVAGVVEYSYFASPDGLITITDMAGLSIHDYLYYEVETGRVYRYVWETDSWYSYLAGGGGVA